MTAKRNEWKTYGPEEDKRYSILFRPDDGDRDKGLYIQLGCTSKWKNREEGMCDSFYAYTDDIGERLFMDLESGTLEDAQTESVTLVLEALKKEKERIENIISTIEGETNEQG